MRELILCPFPITAVICTNEAEWVEVCEKYGIKNRSYIDAEAYADVTGYGSLITIRVNDIPSEFQKVAGICAHEATHAVQEICEYVGEATAGREFQAYYIQRVTEWLLQELECLISVRCTENLQQEPSCSSALDCTLAQTEAQNVL